MQNFFILINQSFMSLKDFPHTKVLKESSSSHFFPVTLLGFFGFFHIFIYLCLAALGLCCCAQALSSCGERGLLSVVVRGPLIAVASPVAEHGL